MERREIDQPSDMQKAIYAETYIAAIERMKDNEPHNTIRERLMDGTDEDDPDDELAIISRMAIDDALGGNPARWSPE